MAGLSVKCTDRVESDIDVTEDDGLIIVADKIPDDWPGTPGIHSYRSLDRTFVFPGEQVRLLVCLSANKHNSGNITASDNVTGRRSPRQKRKVEETNSVLQVNSAHTGEQDNQNGEARGKIDLQNNVSMDQFLQRFENSHFFARIAESNETLWSERSTQEVHFKLMENSIENLAGDSSENTRVLKSKNPISVLIDGGGLHSPTTGGVAKGAAKFCSLSNGDLVVLLQVKVGIEFIRDPIIEILQFEKYHVRDPFLKNQQTQASSINNQYGELLNWLLPLNNARRPSTSPLSPGLSFNSSMPSTPTKRASSVSSGSEIFSFGHIRSYSMSSLQSNNRKAMLTPNVKPSLFPEDEYQFSLKSFTDIRNNGNEKLLSFRGVTLPPERFSIQCGLEGVFTPVRRWRRKLQLIVPLEIHSYYVDCNTDDLLCVNIKNVSPTFAPDVVVFVDSVSMVFEEASSSGPSLSLPVTCTEAGNDYSLPNLALRRGEEHSFILKPIMTLWSHSKGQTDCNRRRPFKYTRPSKSSWLRSSNMEWKHSNPPAGEYAVLVSCRCNYTESKLFYKHPVSWKPRIRRDLMISVEPKTSRQTFASDGTQLPVQAVTLVASNMSFDDLTLTFLAPASTMYSSSIVSTNNFPFSPLTPFEGGVIPYTDLSCTHLCLRSRVPLGCVPSQSMVAFNLDILPLKDGMISLDSLQIDVKEKGRTYVPKHMLKIAANSSIAQYTM